MGDSSRPLTASEWAQFVGQLTSLYELDLESERWFDVSTFVYEDPATGETRDVNIENLDECYDEPSAPQPCPLRCRNSAVPHYTGQRLPYNEAQARTAFQIGYELQGSELAAAVAKLDRQLARLVRGEQPALVGALYGLWDATAALHPLFLPPGRWHPGPADLHGAQREWLEAARELAAARRRAVRLANGLARALTVGPGLILAGSNELKTRVEEQVLVAARRVLEFMGAHPHFNAAWVVADPNEPPEVREQARHRSETLIEAYNRLGFQGPALDAGVHGGLGGGLGGGGLGAGDGGGEGGVGVEVVLVGQQHPGEQAEPLPCAHAQHADVVHGELFE